MQEVFGRVRVQAILEPFLWSSSFCQESYPSINWPLRSTIELFLEFFHKVVKSYCSIIFSRKGRIMSQWSDHGSWQCKTIFMDFSGLMSIHYLSRKGIEIVDNVTAGFSRGPAFATVSLQLCAQRLSQEMVSDVSVSYLLMPFTIRTQETVVSKQRFDHDFNTVTSLMKANLHIQDRADFRVSENHPLTRDASSHRSKVYSRHRFFMSSGPFSSSAMKNYSFFFNNQ